MIDVMLLVALTGLMQAARSFDPHTVVGGTELAFGYLLLAAGSSRPASARASDCQS